MSFAYNFFQGIVQTVGLGPVFSSMTRREEVTDFIMELYRLQSEPSGRLERMTYHPQETVGFLNFQAALSLFERVDELNNLRKMKKKYPDRYKQGIENLALVAYTQAREKAKQLNASGYTVRKFLAQFPA
ncbi:hypothetical protein HYV88_02560 [Candidatus Woesearchaeota archaeon]|nr:hypothetical protein [Candidatus Woesearchaeota archaeon]